MENTNTSLVLQDLNDNVSTLAKIALINLPDGATMAKAERIVMKEIVNFEMVCVLKPELANLDKQSILIAVKQCIADNLTLSPNAGLVYLYPGKVAVGVNPKTNAKEYKDILIYDPTAEGRISIARQANTILDHKRPVCTYDGSGRVDTVTFEFMVPAYPKPRWESVTFNKDNFAKWQQKSAAKYGGTANANYTSWNGGIDPEFAASKSIKHGLKKRGTNANEVANTNYVAPIVNEEKKEVVIEKKPVVEKENNIESVNFEEIKSDNKVYGLPDTNTNSQEEELF